MPRLRQRCDDRLDEMEDAIRAIAREKFPKYDTPEQRNQVPKHLEPELFPPSGEVDGKCCASSTACRYNNLSHLKRPRSRNRGIFGA